MNKHSLLRVFSAVMATLMIVTVVPVFASASSPLVSFPSKYKSMRDMINEAPRFSEASRTNRQKRFR